MASFAALQGGLGMELTKPALGEAAAPVRHRRSVWIRWRLMQVFAETQFLLLYLWHRVMGPPRLLRFHNAMNIRLLRAFGATIGEDARIYSPITVNQDSDDFRNLTIGDHCILNGNNFLDLSARITLEDYVSLGPGVIIMTHNRFNRNEFLEKRLSRMCGCKPVRIGRGAGIKANALILHGVSIGESAVVAGASVVIKDVPARTFVSGAPAVARSVLG